MTQSTNKNRELRKRTIWVWRCHCVQLIPESLSEALIFKSDLNEHEEQ